MRATHSFERADFAESGEPHRSHGTWLRAWQLLRKHRPILIRGAAEFARTRPGEPLSALVVDGDTPEAVRLQAEFGFPRIRVSVGIVQPRADATELLARHAPAHFDWRLADPPGTRRTLPIVVITKAAVLFDVAHYVVPA